MLMKLWNQPNGTRWFGLVWFGLVRCMFGNDFGMIEITIPKRWKSYSLILFIGWIFGTF